jgi:excisionase family DNA binding protein
VSEDAILPLLVSVSEAARLAGVGRDHGYGLVRSGAWPSTRIGRRIRIPRSAVVAWVDAIATNGKAAPSSDEG